MEREEWMRLAEDMRMLVRLFHFELSARTWSDVDIYTRAIDCLDRIIDEVSSAAEREKTVLSLVACLLDDTPFVSKVLLKSDEQELNEKLAVLGAVLRRREISKVFCDKLNETLRCSESLRDVDTLQRYVFLTKREGKLASELLVVLLGDEAPESFQNFLVAVGGPANLLDNLRDARRDHQDGILPLRPGIRLHLRLTASFIRHGWTALRHTPAPLRLAIWGLSEWVRPVSRSNSP